MTTKKAVTMIYKHLNFKNDGLGKAKLFKSVAHSLRIAPSDSNRIISTKILEWDEEKSDENLVWASSVSSKIIKLNSLTDEQKRTIQESFIHKVDAEQKSKNEKSDAIDTLSKYKAKVNKWHNSITDDSDNLKIFLAKILEEKEIFDIEKEINQLSEFDFSRKNQKTETVKKFLQLHNEAIENKSDIARNKVFVQEAFFKIPSHNNVQLKPDDMIFSITSFYSKNFPDYPIKLVVYHGDEIGNHPHIFVEAKNKKTGKYDLLNAQKQFVNDNIDKVKQQYPDAEKLDFSNRSYKAKKLQAQYFQTLFYQHTNNMLLKYNVEAKKLDNTEEHKKRMRLIEEDAKKPKVERTASFHNKQILDLQEELMEIENEIDIKRKIDGALGASIQEKLAEEAFLDSKIEHRHNRIKDLDDSIKEKNSYLEAFKENLDNFVNLVFEKVDSYFSNLLSPAKSKELDGKISNEYETFEDKNPANSVLGAASQKLKAAKPDKGVEFLEFCDAVKRGKFKI